MVRSSMCAKNETVLLLPKPQTAHVVPETFKAKLLVYGFTLLASFSYSWTVILVRYAEVTYGYSPSLFVFLRAVCDILGALMYLLVYRDSLKTLFGLSARQNMLLCTRAIMGAFGILFYFKALQYLPAGDASTLFFLSPAFTIVISRIFLGETVFGTDAFALILNFTGLTLVAQPSFIFHKDVIEDGSSRLNGILAGTLSGLCVAIAYSAHRALGKAVHFMGNVFVLGVASFIISVVIGGYSAVEIFDDSSKGKGVLVAVMSAVVAFFGQCALSKSLQIGPVGVVSTLRSVEIPGIYGLGILVLGEKPSLLSGFGSILVIGGTILITIRRALSPES